MCACVCACVRTHVKVDRCDGHRRDCIRKVLNWWSSTNGEVGTQLAEFYQCLEIGTQLVEFYQW